MGVMNFQDIGRIPSPGDNAAIATTNLDAGTRFIFGKHEHSLSHSILEGHRFAIEPIPKAQALYSWGLPFGRTLREIQPGDYLCNAAMLDALRLRSPDFKLPALANFQDIQPNFVLDEAAFRPGKQVPPHAQQSTFEGYVRSGGRGVGTRNDIVILGTTSLTASFARALESRLKSGAGKYPNLDGIVAVTHTEGGGSRRPNNLEFVLRTLAGFIVHPNVGAVLAVDYGTEVLTNAMLEKFLRDHDYPLDHVLHRFYSISRDFNGALDECTGILRAWLTAVSAMPRVAQPLSELKIALQCGGSDAFSGVSGNPLAGRVAREVIRHGGSANLAETDELIGAEPYILANTRDLATAQRFLEKIAIFKERVAWHGHSAEGNTTGGNKLRGLYNNALKSIGAARKKDPDVRLDYVIDYGQCMTEPGFYFMDSPGNDLESIAGQVASGCNMIFFITGNGSITNFPFVPTIKFITTTGRWNLLSKDMDVNAGRYQDGTPMDDLSMETFRYTADVASGMRSVGERAGHSQVSIWRDWRQTNNRRLEELLDSPRASGKPIAISRTSASNASFKAFITDRGFATDQVGLIMPTSLCSGQIAARIASDLNTRTSQNLPRFVSLLHTEGCGTSGGENEMLFTRTLVGHLVHPFVKEALLLEHGCEHTHNDLMRHVLKQHGIDPDRFGYASVQLDGGIERVVKKVEQWFMDRLAPGPPPERQEVGLEALSLGILSVGPLHGAVAASLAVITAAIVGRGGTVVLPENTALINSMEFLEGLSLKVAPLPTLDYGQSVEQPGFHVMSTPTGHIVETLTGLGGTGVQIILVHVGGPPVQAHPMIPVVQVTTYTKADCQFHEDMDYVIHPDDTGSDQISEKLMCLLCETASQTYVPKLCAAGYTDFQLTRGLLGVSL